MTKLLFQILPETIVSAISRAYGRHKKCSVIVREWKKELEKVRVEELEAIQPFREQIKEIDNRFHNLLADVREA